MPKLTSAQRKVQLNRLFAKYNQRLGILYSNYVKKLASLDYGEDVLEGDALFNFDNFPELKAKLNAIFENYFQNSMFLYKQGITDGVFLAYTHDNDLLGNYTILSDKALQTARKTAAASFIVNRLNSKKGLNLSQTVWNYCSQTKSEFEMAMSNVIADGIKGGTSAEEIGKQIRKYLNNPDMMYRRYHTIKVQKNGKKKDVVTWRRRRIIDGKVRFVEEPLEKVGMGVYRSSRKNALRVARTEINAAYHKASNERWQNEPFVIGQYIHVSPQHAIEDICDEVEGRYPKDFVWTQWHPSCLCTSDPIMIEGEERKEFYRRLMNGEDMSGYVSPYTIKDVPDKYKQYIIDNEAAIVKAVKKDKLAWHLADNKKYWTSLLSKEQREALGLTSQEDIRKAILEKAKLRHSQRTQEQIDKIQSKWNGHRRKLYNDRVKDLIGSEYISDKVNDGDLFNRYYAGREAILEGKSVSELNTIFERFKQGWQIKQVWTDRKVAMNVVKVAQKYGETDFKAVQTALNAADYAKARQEAKKLAQAISAIQKDEAELSKLIPDVNTWHKQFTSEQLHGVYDAVESKLNQWSGLTLEQKQKKLHFEAYDFLGGNMHGVQQKYATWQVSQSAYMKELASVENAIEWAKINDALPDVYGYKTQSKIYHKLVYDLKNAVASNDKDHANQLLNEAKIKKQALIDAKLKRSVNKSSSSSIPFDSDAYSQARKDAAVWCQSAEESHAKWDVESNAIWNSASAAERAGCSAYTGGSGHMNRPLRGYDRCWGWDYFKGVGNVALDNEYGEAHIRDLYNMINRCASKEDIWLQRGVESWDGVEGLFGVKGLTIKQLSKMVGKEITDWSFTSCGSAKGTGFSGTIFNIYCPKGTKMYYAAPHSQFYHENETILQLGTRFRITKVEVTPWGNVYVDMEVIGYDNHPLL